MSEMHGHIPSLVIGHDPENDYEGVYRTFLTKVEGEVGTVHQICQLMTIDALERVAQHATDQWTFESGTERDRKVLEIVEFWLKAKREETHDREHT